jgi:hypothetical protein
MRNFFIIITAICFTQIAIAQNAIPNPGFETWTNFGNYEDPDDWGTINSLTVLLGVKTLTKATGADAHSGSSAVKLESKTVAGQTAPGIIATGTINPSTQAVDGGVPFNLRPTSFTGWYKYAPATSDNASISATLSKWNSSTNQREQVGEASFTESATIGSYSQFNVAFTYSSNDAPDTLLIVILSSSGSNPQVGSILFVDDLAFEYSSGISMSASQSLKLYPNPATNNVVFVELPEYARYDLQITDITGKTIFASSFTDNNLMIDTHNFAEGNYHVIVKNMETGTVRTNLLLKE